MNRLTIRVTDENQINYSKVKSAAQNLDQKIKSQINRSYYSKAISADQNLYHKMDQQLKIQMKFRYSGK